MSFCFSRISWERKCSWLKYFKLCFNKIWFYSRRPAENLLAISVNQVSFLHQQNIILSAEANAAQIVFDSWRIFHTTSWLGFTQHVSPARQGFAFQLHHGYLLEGVSLTAWVRFLPDVLNECKCVYLLSFGAWDVPMDVELLSVCSVQFGYPSLALRQEEGAKS